jgi:hypothetical protein
VDLEDLLYNINGYLGAWDRFAQGESGLAGFLNEYHEPFENLLAASLYAGYAWAPSRVVFYTLVQVGGTIEVESHLGREWRAFTEDSFPVVSGKGGVPVYFAAHFYDWWMQSGHRYPRYDLLEEWLSREFARTTAIPMYQSLLRQEGQLRDGSGSG